MSVFRLPDRPEIQQAIRVARHALATLMRSRLPQMAAALSYRTIFGLFPALIVGLVVLRAFASPDDLASIIQRGLRFTGISQIVLGEGNDGAAPDADSGRGDTADAPQEQVSPQEATPAAGDGAASDSGPPHPNSVADAQRLDQWIEDRVTTLGSLNFATIGVVGIVVLIYAAIAMLVEVERAFNQIYRAPAARAWSRRVPLYWTVLTLGSLVLVASFSISEWFRTMLAGLADARGLQVWDLLLAGLGFLMTVCISMILLLFLFRTLPNAHVKLRAAIVGALISAVLWEAGKWGFTRYLHYSTSYQRLYGQMALLPLFLLWIYVTWLIVCFGLQVSYGIQMFSTWREELDQDQEVEGAIVDPASTIAVVAVIARAFAKGRNVRVDEVSTETGLREEVARRMLDALAGAGIVNRLTNDEEPAYALARPASDIDAAELVHVGQRMVSEPAHDRTRAFYDELRTRTRDLVVGRTVDQLVSEPSPDGEAPSRTAHDAKNDNTCDAGGKSADRRERDGGVL